MVRFVGRQRDLADLSTMTANPGAHFLLVYGRRRVGKTTLLLEWARQTGLPVCYWVAKRDTPAMLQVSLLSTLWEWQYNEESPPFAASDWEEVFHQAQQAMHGKRVIFILDEFSYAAESDSSLTSYLQAAWDHLFKDSEVILILTGSHIGMMRALLEYQAPLYGRFTGQLLLEPLSFNEVGEFLPRYDPFQRMAVYATLGGIPAYLERWDDRQTIAANLENLFMRRTAMLHGEPAFLLNDLLRRETSVYEGILKAISRGAHTPSQISTRLDVSPSYLSKYLMRLQDLRLLERRVPATLPPEKHKQTKTSRYHLRDAYLRFYYRFIEPHLHLIEREMWGALWRRIEHQYRSFVALAFEELCREWVVYQARRSALPLIPETLGQHWSKDAQIDVVAVDWLESAILLGEAKWGDELVDGSTIARLLEQGPKAVPKTGDEWRIHYYVFARQGFTPAAQDEAAQAGVQLLTLEDMLPGLENDFTQPRRSLL